MNLSIRSICSALLFLLPFSSFAQTQNTVLQDAEGNSYPAITARTVYNFPPPFDYPGFPFKVVTIDATTPDWAKILYDVNPNIRNIMTLHQAWRKNNPEVKNGHTRNYKKLIGYLMENNAVNDEGFIDLPTPQEIEEERQQLINDRRNFSNKNNSASRSTNSTMWEYMAPSFMRETDGRLSNRQINVYSITQSLSNPDILYCATEAGGTIFKTTDNGLNWFSVSDDLIVNMGARNIEVTPTNPDIVFIGTKHDVYKTTNGGGTWTSVRSSNNMDTRTILLHPTHVDTLLTGGNYGIEKSNDGGATWTTVLPNASIYDLRYQPNNPQVVYALVNNSTTNQTDFYKSTDGGDTWTVRNIGWPNEASNSNRGGQMTTSDGHPHIIFAFVGATWTNANNTNGIKILKSSDYGETWTLKVDYDNVKGINSGQGYYDWDIEMSDVDSNIVACGTQNSWISYDGFETVTTSMRNGWSGHADIQEMLFNGDEIWVVNDGGITKYENDSLYTYDVRSKGVSAISYWSFDQGWNTDVAIGTHYHNGTSFTHENYEANLAVSLGGAEPSFSLVAQPNAEKVVSKGYGSVNGYVIPENQNGNFSRFSYNIEPNQNSYDGTSITNDLLHHNTHYAALNNTVMKSTDFGVTWNTLASFSKSGEYVEAIELTRANLEVIYVGTTHSSGSSVYRSADGGASFVEMTSPFATNNFHISVSNENENIIFAGGDRKYSSGGEYVKIAKSIDGGVTWIDLWTSMLDGYDFRKVLQVDGTNGGIYLLTTRAVFYRNNTLQDWELLTDGIPTNASWGYIKPFYRDNQLRVATSRGTFKANLYETPQLSSALLQPTVNQRKVSCGKDTLQFDDFSVVVHAGATWQWTFPGATYVSDLNIRNPKVVYGQSGTYDVTMAITQDGQTYTKTIEAMIEVGTDCDSADEVAGNAVTFEGTSSDYIQLDKLNSAATNTFTISAWIKPDGAQKGFAGIVTNGVWCAHCNDQTFGLVYNYHGDRLYYRWPNSTSGWSSSSGMYVPQDEWSYVAMVMSPDQVTLYLNDQKWVQNISHAPVEIPTLYIGDGHYSGGHFKGNIDEVSIWNKSLTEEEIKELMHLTKDPAQDADLLAYYQFNTEAGDAINKVGGSHGILSGNVERVVSTAPIGGGNSDTQMEANGNISFANSGLEINYINQSGVEIVASQINQTPYNLNGLLENDTPLDDQYWAVHRFGSGSYAADFIFQPNENLTAADETAPSRLALYGRGNRSDEDWKYIVTSHAVNASNNTITFSVEDDYQQYLVARASQGILRATELITLNNTLVGSLSEEASYLLSGANLTQDALVTAPTDFEISLTSGSGFSNSLAISPVNGKIEATIYVRFLPTENKVYFGNITHTSIGVNTHQTNVEGLGFELDRVPGMALDLDGSSDYVNLGNPTELQITGDLTIQMWLKPSNFSARRNPIGKAYGGEFTITQETNGTLTFYNGQSGGNSGGYQQIGSDSTLNLNEWNHITIVRDLTNAQRSWYINGKLTNQAALSSTSIVAGNNSVYIGEGYVSGYAGLIDEVRIWNTPLTEQQIREEMHLTLQGNETGLVAYYQFNQPSGNAKDFINGLDGTFVNQATRSLATEPVGGGFSNTQMETNGVVNFPNTTFTSNFISQNGATVVASKLELAPNDVLGIGANETPADQQYWVVNRYGTGNATANLTFGTSENLSAEEEAAPNTLKLYGRNQTSDGTWTFIANANQVISANNEIIYNNAITFQQYLITRNPFPKITIENVVLNFGNITQGTSSDELQYTISATDLTNNLIINAPVGFEISETSGTNFGSNLTLTPNAGTVASKTIYVRFSPTDDIYYSGEITHTSTGATSRNISLQETGVLPEIEVRQDASILASNTNIDFGSLRIGASAPITFSIKNKNLGTLVLSGTPKIVVAGTNATDFVVNETSTLGNLEEAESTTFEITFTPSANGTRTANISITNNDEDENPFVLNLMGIGEATPSILVNSNLTPFALQQTGSSSVLQSYTVSATDLLNDVVITATPNFELSLNNGSGFSTSPIRLGATNGSLSSTTIYVRFVPSSVSNFAGSILHTSDQATTQTINLTGESYQLAAVTPGNALQFDGSNSAKASDVNLPISTQATLEFWANYEGAIGANNSVIDIRDATNDRVFNIHFPWGSRLYFDAGNSDGYDRIDKTVTIEDLAGWHHWAFVKDATAGIMKIYRDGELWEEGTGKNRNFSTPDDIYFGKHNYGGSYFEGKLDEVRVWNTARTQQEIRENMHLTQLSTNANLLGYYQFNETNFSSIYNIKAGSHGTLYGAERITSTVPTGEGFSNTQNEMNGTVLFPTTNFETNFTAQNAAEVVVSRINLAPNLQPAALPRIFDAQYWAVHRYGTGAFAGDITFSVSEDLTNSDETYPENIVLYGRGATTDTTWQLLGSALSVDATTNQVTFEDVTSFTQFLVASTTEGGDTDCLPEVYYENTIALPDTTNAIDFIEAGNLTGLGNVEIKSTQIIVFEAADIILKPGFVAETGSDFTAKQGDCFALPILENRNVEEIFTFKEHESPDNKVDLNVFPNPSKTAITVTYVLEENTQVSIELFDVLGKRVKTILPNQAQPEGNHQVHYPHKGLRSGTYFLLMRVNDEVRYEKVIIL